MYKTLEEQIIELWKSRGMNVEVIKFRTKKNKGIWTIVAPLLPSPMKLKTKENIDENIRRAMKEKVGDWSLSKPFNWRRKNAFQK